MRPRWPVALLCLSLLIGAALLGAAGRGTDQSKPVWVQVAPGILRSSTLPAGHALVDGDTALLVDAPLGPVSLKAHGITKIDAVLLTHHHRDSCAAVGEFLRAGVKVRAAKESAKWLSPEGVRKYWEESLPLRSSNTAYLVAPEGFAGIAYDLADGTTLSWHGWTIRAVAAPGHSHDHLAFAARKGPAGRLLIFCGDAFASPGKLWTPYTTDWDHWTDAGLTPAAKSLRRLADLQPDVLLPAHGLILDRDAADALRRTAKAVEEVAFLKSYERYTKKRLGNAPSYRFLAKEQAGSNGSLPWSHVSEHLYYTGNTWVLVSKEDEAFLVVDPWGKRSAEQIAKLKRDRKLGKLEVVMFSHAHYDHYDGVYDLPDRDSFQIWMLDQAATPVAQPFLLRAPFLDPRPVRIDRRPHEGEVLTWREYRFRFHHLPGQTIYTMGVETTIDGKRCLFTADNWFHQDLYSGTGGWMGLNRSCPLGYAQSAHRVRQLAPEWVLAEHGGAFEYNAEDFRRREEWGRVSARAADAICPSGNHLYDWDPQAVHVEPLVQKARPGAILKGTLVASNVLPRKQVLTIILEGRGLTADQTWKLEVPAGQTVRRSFTLRLSDRLPPGRHVLTLRVTSGDCQAGADAFVAADVEE
jgi:glyoxylase-like metal-dependent hydrolase (beta-lactamase superfamily II)